MSSHLFHCSACSSLISRKATSCPKCGHPVPDRFATIKGCFTAIICVVFFLLVYALATVYLR
jgi:uncharacterized paraquat-inducible protein A